MIGDSIKNVQITQKIQSCLTHGSTRKTGSRARIRLELGRENPQPGALDMASGCGPGSRAEQRADELHDGRASAANVHTASQGQHWRGGHRQHGQARSQLHFLGHLHGLISSL